MRTVARPIEGTEVRLEPKESPGIEINGVPVSLDAIGKADVRVDLVSDAGRQRSFVVEHALAPLGLHGITSASVVGIRDDWTFARPEHRFCYSAELGPDAVVGHPEGLPNPALASVLDDVGIVEGEIQSRQTVSKPVTFTANGGKIELWPRDYGEGIRFEARYGDAEITAEVDPRGENDPDLIDSVASAKTPYLTPEDGEAVTHSIADLVADVAVVGGFDDLFVEADLGKAYHALTIGAAREARRQGVVDHR
jgi:hypothetical protein